MLAWLWTFTSMAENIGRQFDSVTSEDVIDVLWDSKTALCSWDIQRTLTAKFPYKRGITTKWLEETLEQKPEEVKNGQV